MSDMFVVLFSILFLTVGIMAGFIANEKWNQYLAKEKHEFDELFKENPHPELFDANGEIDRGDDYIVINFPLGFDPSVDGFDIIPPDEEW